MILVCSEGQLAESGSHEELMKRKAFVSGAGLGFGSRGGRFFLVVFVGGWKTWSVFFNVW